MSLKKNVQMKLNLKITITVLIAFLITFLSLSIFLYFDKAERTSISLEEEAKFHFSDFH